MSMQIAEFSDQLNAFLARVGAGEPHWPGQGMSRGDLWLTEDETRDLLARITETIDEYSKGRTPQRHPKGGRKLTYVWSLIPTD